MLNIIVCGDKKDIRITELLIELLKDNYKINFLSNKEMLTVGKGKNINIIDSAMLEQINCKNSIIIIKHCDQAKSLKRLDWQNAVIISSQNLKGIARLSAFTDNIYTCGYSSKDYMTFSSREVSDAIISLQRPIHSPLNMQDIDTQEIAAKLKNPLDDYSLLAVTLAYIFIKNRYEKTGEIIDKIYF